MPITGWPFLLAEIERLRVGMHGLAATGVRFAEVLAVSQRLNNLSVEFYKKIGKAAPKKGAFFVEGGLNQLQNNQTKLNKVKQI